MMADDNTTGFEEPVRERAIPRLNAEESAPRGRELTPEAGRTPVEMDLGDDAGAGLEDMSLDEQVTPFLNVVQTGSPQVKQENAEYVPGIMPGMLFDTASMEFHDALIRQGAPPGLGCQAMICGRELEYAVLIPLERGGGFRGALKQTDPFVREALERAGNKYRLPRFKDNKWSNPEAVMRYGADEEEVELVETIKYYLLYGPSGEDLNEGNAMRAIMRFKSTSLQVATGINERLKRWVYKTPDGQMSAAQIWSYRWLIRTVPVARGTYSWYNPQFTLVPTDARPPYDTKAMIDRTGQLFQLGREFHELFRRGKVKVDETKGGLAGAEAEEDEAPPF